MFPLAVLVCFIREANRDRALTLAWCTFGLAVATAATMAASEPGAFNWGWGLHLAAAVLFCESAAFLLRQERGWRAIGCYAVLAVHAICGVAYVAGCLRVGRF